MAENAARLGSIRCVETQSLFADHFSGQLTAGFGAQPETIEPPGRGHPRLTAQDLGSGSFLVQYFVSRLSETPGEVRRTGCALVPHNAEAYGGLLDLEKDGWASVRKLGVA